MKQNLDNLWELISTWFYIGKSRYAPGTVGSIATLPLVYLLHSYLGTWSVIVFAILISLIGIVAAEKFSKAIGIHDPGMIVVDEVAGQTIALTFAGINLYLYLVGFILFRIFDITKPWPVGWVDKKISGGLGIMLDDILAGFIAMVLLLLFKTYIF